MKRVALVLAEGFEEVEAVTPIDFLRRAGVEVIVATLGAQPVRGSHGIAIAADTTIEALPEELDGVVLPGGTIGAENLGRSAEVAALVKRLNARSKLVAAICAAPAKVLAPAGILSGRRATCFPGLEGELSGAVFTTERVVRDRNIVTSRSAGTAGEFAIELVRYLSGSAEADKVRSSVLQR